MVVSINFPTDYFGGVVCDVSRSVLLMMMESGVGVVNVGNIVPWCILVVVLLSSFSLGFCTFLGHCFATVGCNFWCWLFLN